MEILRKKCCYCSLVLLLQVKVKVNLSESYSKNFWIVNLHRKLECSPTIKLLCVVIIQYKNLNMKQIKQFHDNILVIGNFYQSHIFYPLFTLTEHLRNAI